MRRKAFRTRACDSCGHIQSKQEYAPTNSPFHLDGRLPICNRCLGEGIAEGTAGETDWLAVDNICQWADWPFIPEEWTKAYVAHGARNGIRHYGNMFFREGYLEKVEWQKQNAAWLDLHEAGELYRAHPELEQKHLLDMQERWGGDYLPDELRFLERTYKEMHEAYSVSQGIQEDNVIRMCKISLHTDRLINSGEKFDHMLKGYETCMNIAQLSPTRVSSGEDFESVGEVFAYLEKTGWMASFTVDEPQDVVDETMMNIETNLQHTVLGEPNIKDMAQSQKEAYEKNIELERRITSNETDVYSNEAYNPEDFVKRIHEEAAPEPEEWELQEDYDEDNDNFDPTMGFKGGGW